MDALLQVRGLSASFGGVVAADDVTFEVERGEILGLIGPNGAGKTTIFNCITRIARPDAGSVRFAGSDLVNEHRGGWRRRWGRGVAPHAVVGRGIARTFQTPALFPSMTVLDN